jgi:CheY-like chemotaxis protein
MLVFRGFADEIADLITRPSHVQKATKAMALSQNAQPCRHVALRESYKCGTSPRSGRLEWNLRGEVPENRRQWSSIMQIGVETSKAVDQRRVFVVDEDEIIRAALQFMLHDEIETHELASLEEVYAKGTGWLTPDLILLGVSIVREHGESVVTEIVARYPTVRVLVVTGKEDETIAIAAIKAGAHGALVKPLTLEAVRKKVDTVLGRAGGATLVQLGGL